MFAEVGAVRREVENGAIERAAFALDDTHDEIDVIGAGDAAKLVHGGAGNVHAAFPIALEVATAFVGAIANDGAEIEAARVSGDERFGKNDESRAFGGSFCGKRSGFLESSLAIEGDGGGLCSWFSDVLEQEI
ncbi:MAG: hypothetical protein NVS9B14_05000 [Candidatus Acidiferrum sp.]